VINSKLNVKNLNVFVSSVSVYLLDRFTIPFLYSYLYQWAFDKHTFCPYTLLKSYHSFWFTVFFKDKITVYFLVFKFSFVGTICVCQLYQVGSIKWIFGSKRILTQQKISSYNYIYMQFMLHIQKSLFN
jgi:hypothetical protein